MSYWGQEAADPCQIMFSENSQKVVELETGLRKYAPKMCDSSPYFHLLLLTKNNPDILIPESKPPAKSLAKFCLEPVSRLCVVF